MYSHHLSHSEGAAMGKALRDKIPRSSHSEWKPRSNRLDPIGLLKASNKGRLPGFVPIRYGRMLSSPFAFLRGAVSIMAADLSETPKTGIKVQACGDCHLSNFGGYGTPERNLVFDINDFDESLPAPWEWDIKRLAASIVVAGQYLNLTYTDSRTAAYSTVQSYRKHMNEYAQMTALDVWYAHIEVESLLTFTEDNREQKRLKKEVKKARTLKPVWELHKLTEKVNGQHRFINNYPLVFHPSDQDLLTEEWLTDFHKYRNTLRDDFRVLLDQYQVVDVAIKVVGVGSVGTRCGVALLVAGHNDPLFLQIKEARASVMESYAGKSIYKNHAQRVVMGQHLMQASSDIFLGWTRGDSGHDFYLRQLRDMKMSVEIEEMSNTDLIGYAKLCGWTLARAHARSGNRFLISGYLGRSDAFDQAIADFAIAYSDQTEQDYKALVHAVKRGKLESIIKGTHSTSMKKPNDNAAKQRPAINQFRLFQGILPLRKSTIGTDIVAGIVLAALGIPEVMGYTKIAGTPIETGLYTLIFPVLAFAILGSSRHLVVGADSATAAILAAGLSGLAQSNSPQYLALAEWVAILAAGILFLARLFRLGFLADFLSRTVLIGFLTGVGIQVAIGQLPELLGLNAGGQTPVEQIINHLKRIPHINLLTLCISMTALAIILLFNKFMPKLPGALLAVIGAIIASRLFDFAHHGVAIVGSIPSGLPSIGLPAVSIKAIPQVFSIALSCCLVIIAQSAATSRAYAFRYNERFKENVDLEGLAAANLAAGLTGTFVVNGSPTKTEIVDSAGGRSQVSQLATVGVVLIVILFLTQPISYLPNSVLSAIVFLIGLKLIDIQGMQAIFKTHREEFYLAIITALTVVFLGVKEGILLAVSLSLILHVRHSYRPHSAIIIPNQNGLWQPIPVRLGTVSTPGIIIYRFSRDLFYANATFFSEEIQNLIKSAELPVKWFILEARAITEIDYSASQTVRDLLKELSILNVTFIVSGLSPDVKEQFDRDGLTELIGSNGFFYHLEEALKTIQSRH
jgi:sulfate permease, SulP family